MNSAYSQRQALFANLIARHIAWLFEAGFECTCGDFFAHDGHMINSVHYDKMAADLNIFFNGKWMDGNDLSGTGNWQEDLWEKIGAHWESLDPLCRWGGRFSKRDYNHFSVVSLDGSRA